jgi:glycosyltransferase involved in cell wall biosynthesis
MQRPVLWCFLPTGIEAARAVGARLVVYHCVDHYAANPGVDRAWVETLEARMLERADLVLASSPVLAERLRARRADAECWPNVADVTLFRRAVEEELAEPPELQGQPHPRAIYVGNLAGYRIDFDLLEASLRGVAPGVLVLVGVEGLGDAGAGGAAWECLRERPGLLRLGPRAPEALPALLQHADVALIPFLDNEHTRGSLPLKLWEYLAAGLPVVARDLPNLRELAREGWVRTAPDAAGFEAALREVLAGAAGSRAERSRRAVAHGWEERMEALTERVGQALEDVRRPSFPGETRRV